MRSQLLRSFAGVLAATAWQASAATSLLNVKSWEPTRQIISNEGKFTGLIAGSTAINDDQDLYSLILSLTLVQADIPDNVGIKLEMPVPGSETDVVTIDVALAGDDLKTLMLKTHDAAGSLIQSEKYAVQADCSVREVSGKTMAQYFSVMETETCLEGKKATIVLQRGLGGVLQTKPGQSYADTKLTYSENDTVLHEGVPFTVAFEDIAVANVPASNAQVGFNENAWSAGDWDIKIQKTTLGTIRSYTTLAPLQFGPSRELAFFWTIQAEGASLMPGSREWGFEWEIPLPGSSVYEEIGSVFFEGDTFHLQQSVLNKVAKRLQAGSDVDVHYYSKADDDCGYAHSPNDKNSASQTYWRIFLPHTCLKGDTANITLTRNAGDQLDLKTGGTLSGVEFYYRYGGRELGRITTSLTWGGVSFPADSARRQLASENEEVLFELPPPPRQLYDSDGALSLASASFTAAIAAVFLF